MKIRWKYSERRGLHLLHGFTWGPGDERVPDLTERALPDSCFRNARVEVTVAAGQTRPRLRANGRAVTWFRSQLVEGPKNHKSDCDAYFAVFSCPG